jgi:hypothetical protein
MQIGDTYITPYGAALLAFGVSALGVTLIGVLLSQTAIKIRSTGKRLAMRQVKMDFPNEEVVECKIIKDGILELASIYFRSGRSVKYRIAKREEMAFLIRD